MSEPREAYVTLLRKKLATAQAAVQSDRAMLHKLLNMGVEDAFLAEYAGAYAASIQALRNAETAVTLAESYLGGA